MSTGKNEHNGEEQTGEDQTGADAPEVSYTPEQRRLILMGLRIWARVAIGSYMRQHGAALSLPEAAPAGGEEEGQ